MENIKEKFEFEVNSEYEGMRLDKYLSEQIEEATRSYLEKLIDNNYVKVNSKVINKNGRKLKLGEKYLSAYKKLLKHRSKERRKY